MRLFKPLVIAVLLLLLCSLSAVYACGLFRGRGFRRGSCGGGASQVQVMPPVQFAAPMIAEAGGCASCASCAQCSVQASGDCACCDNCPCDKDDCPCKQGKAPCSSGCRCLLSAKPAVDSAKFPGIVQHKMGQSGEQYTLNGRKVKREDVISALSTVPDDRKELSLTFIGSTDDERSKAVALAKSMGLDSKTLIQAYPADNPLVRDKGFLSGTYLQTPDGKPLLRSARMDRATLLAVAEKATAYDPAKDPTPDSLSLSDLEKKLASLPGWVWALAGAGVVYLYLKRQEQPK